MDDSLGNIAARIAERLEEPLDEFVESMVAAVFDELEASGLIEPRAVRRPPPENGHRGGTLGH